MRLKSRELPFIKFIYLLDLASSQVLESIGNREISLISRLNIALVYIIFSYRKEREKASEVLCSRPVPQCLRLNK